MYYILSNILSVYLFFPIFNHGPHNYRRRVATRQSADAVVGTNRYPIWGPGTIGDTILFVYMVFVLHG